MEREVKTKNLGELDDKLFKTILFDALQTTVALHDPTTTLKGDELALYTLSETPFSTDAVENLPKVIKLLGLEAEFKQIYSELQSQNLPPKRMYYVLCDRLSEVYCKKNNDATQQMRMEVIKKIYHLADPEIFSKVLEYSKKNFGKPLNLVLLTNANPLMKEVYTQMVQKYGVEVLVAPNPKLDSLRKEDPALYKKIAELYKSQTSNFGLLDDQQKNTEAAKEAGTKVKLFDAKGYELDSAQGRAELEKSSKKLVDILHGEDTPEPEM